MNTRDQALTLMRALGLTPDATETAKQQQAIECALDEAVHRQRIASPCPACGRAELFIGAGGLLTCSNLECSDPGRAHRILGQARYILAPDARLSPTTAANTGHEVPVDTRTHRFDRISAYRIAQGPNGEHLFIEWCQDCEDAFLIRVGGGPERLFVPLASRAARADEELTMITLALKNQDVAEGAYSDVTVQRGVELLIERAYELRGLLRVKDEDFNALYADYCDLKEQAERLVRHLDGSDGMPAAWWLEAADAVRQIGRIVWPLGEAVDGAEKALPGTDEGRP